MADSQRVRCETHGERRRTFVCRHLVRGAGLGFCQGKSLSDEEASEPCAWCDECEKVRIKCGGDWTDESEGFAGVTLICDLCFGDARRRNLRPRAKQAWWKFW